jgi:hypothetical protein
VQVYIFFSPIIISGVAMFLSDKIGKPYFYKGVNKVKVVTESEGYWIIEALEDFVDYVDGERVAINMGERRLVPPDALSSEMVLLPPIQEHVYERQMEKKVQRLVAAEEAKEKAAKK